MAEIAPASPSDPPAPGAGGTAPSRARAPALPRSPRRRVPRGRAAPPRCADPPAARRWPAPARARARLGLPHDRTIRRARRPRGNKGRPPRGRRRRVGVRDPGGSPRPIMDKRGRVLASLGRKPVDRPPVSFWRHVPDVDHTAKGLADAMLAFHRRWDLDLIKAMSTGVYCVEDWGCDVAYHGAVNGAKVCSRHAVQTRADWARM